MSFDVNVAAMRAHADQVEGLVGRADRAVDAARSVSFHPQAFGSIGAALVYPLVAPLEAAGCGATVAVSTSLSGTATGLRGAARTFELVEDAVVDLMTTLHKVL